LLIILLWLLAVLGPACFKLLASNSGTGPHIDLIHTKALAGYLLLLGSILACSLHVLALALEVCWGIQLLLVSFTRLTAIVISCLFTRSTSPSQ
jgi:hypothetical protein